MTRGSQVYKQDGLFCIHYARGCCSQGSECSFLHRIPIPSDESRIDRTRDCFGRERHRLDRDDMGGTGSFERENTTLYIGRCGVYENMEVCIFKIGSAPFVNFWLGHYKEALCCLWKDRLRENS